MTKLIFTTTDSYAPFLLRIFLGTVVMAHGVQKLFGWFGGYGYKGTMGFFTETVGLPWILGFSVIILESFGALVLMMGLATRIIAIFYTALAVGIATTVHLSNGFFMNWPGNQAGEGIEYFLLWIGMSTALILVGGGRFSIDYYLQRR